MYAPKLRYNLYSITKWILEGGILSNEGNIIVLSFEDYEIKFDYPIKTKNEYVIPAVISKVGINKKLMDHTKTMNINSIYAQTHQGEQHIKASALRLIKLIGKLNACIHCARKKQSKLGCVNLLKIQRLNHEIELL